MMQEAAVFIRNHGIDRENGIFIEDIQGAS